MNRCSLFKYPLQVREDTVSLYQFWQASALKLMHRGGEIHFWRGTNQGRDLLPALYLMITAGISTLSHGWSSHAKSVWLPPSLHPLERPDFSFNISWLFILLEARSYCMKQTTLFTSGTSGSYLNNFPQAFTSAIYLKCLD